MGESFLLRSIFHGILVVLLFCKAGWGSSVCLVEHRRLSSSAPLFIPLYPKARALHFSDIEFMSALQQENSPSVAFLGAANLWAWNRAEHYEISQLSGTILMQAKGLSSDRERVWYEPCGGTPDDRARAIFQLLKVEREVPSGQKNIIRYVSPEVAAILKEKYLLAGRV